MLANIRKHGKKLKASMVSDVAERRYGKQKKLFALVISKLLCKNRIW